MTDAEILDFCEENDVEVSFNFEKLTEGYRIRIRRGYFQYCTFVTCDQIEATKEWGSAIKITLIISRICLYTKSPPKGGLFSILGQKEDKKHGTKAVYVSAGAYQGQPRLARRLPDLGG